MVPKYTKPDVLKVEVSFNGQDFTNDKLTYGFFDPFVLSVSPRLISTKGTTRVRLYGFGFVNSSSADLKSMYGSVDNGPLVASGQACVREAEFIDKNTMETSTFPESMVTYKNDGSRVGKNGITVEASVLNNIFTENNVEVWYYEEPIYK